MTSPTPYQGDDAYTPPRRCNLRATTVSTSPAAFNLTLPAQGAWLVTATTWFGTQNDRAMLNAILHWYRYSGSWMLAAIPLGSPTLIGLATGLTISAPTSGGVVTVTATSSRGNSGVAAGLDGILLSSASDQASV